MVDGGLLKMDKNVHIRKILMVEDIVIISNRTDAV